MPTIVQIPVTQLDPHPHNPRRDLGDLTDLTKSIKAQGIRQNLLVTPTGEDVSIDEVGLGTRHRTRYTVVIGHRRLAAAIAAHLSTVPCVVEPVLSDADQLELMLVENLQRTDLTPIEEAKGYQDLLDLNVSEASIARNVGRSSKTVKARLQLLTLPPLAQDRIHHGQGSLADAAALEEFADDMATQERLSTLLGTRDFDQKLREARDDRKRRAQQQPIVDALAARGWVEIDEIDWKERRLRIDSVETVDAANKVTLREGGVFNRNSWSASVTLYGPARTQDDEYIDQAQDDAEWEARNQAREALRATQEAAYAVRDEWFRARVEKPVTKQVELGITYLLAIPSAMSNRQWSVRTWFEIESYDQSAIREALTAWAEKCGSYALVLVLWLHAGITELEPADKPLIEALQLLGYTPSTDELAWVKGPEEAIS